MLVDQPVCILEKSSSSKPMEQAEIFPAASQSNAEISMKENRRENLPKLTDILTDAGVLYAHRNKDVVNFGAQNLEGLIEGANLNHAIGW